MLSSFTYLKTTTTTTLAILTVQGGVRVPNMLIEV